jgi:hypothetical protein
MLSEETVLALAQAASFQDLGEGEGAVVMRTDSGQLYTCNDTTAALLNYMDGSRQFGEILDLLQEEFEVAREVLAADLAEVIVELEREGIVESVPASR